MHSANNGSDTLEIVIKGSPEAVAEVLQGKAINAIERMLTSQQDLIVHEAAKWKAQDELRLAQEKIANLERDLSWARQDLASANQKATLAVARGAKAEEKAQQLSAPTCPDDVANSFFWKGMDYHTMTDEPARPGDQAVQRYRPTPLRGRCERSR